MGDFAACGGGCGEGGGGGFDDLDPTTFSVAVDDEISFSLLWNGSDVSFVPVPLPAATTTAVTDDEEHIAASSGAGGDTRCAVAVAVVVSLIPRSDATGSSLSPLAFSSSS